MYCKWKNAYIKDLNAWRIVMNFYVFILSKKVTHNILVHRQVQIIVGATCVLYISYVIEYKEWNFEGFW